MTNILDVVKSGLCMQCGICIQICPRNNNIKASKDSSHDLVLSIKEEEICNGCGMCLKVCPGHEVNFVDLSEGLFDGAFFNHLIGYYRGTYLSYAIDKQIREKAASGGITTALLIYMLNKKLVNGALVVSNTVDTIYDTHSYIARTADEVKKAAKSKYYPTHVHRALGEILKNKGKTEKFAIVGLPCHIHGFRKLEKISKNFKKQISLYISLFCGWTSTYGLADYLLSKAGIKNTQLVREINFRAGRWPGHIEIVLKDGRKISLPGGEKDRVSHLYFLWRCSVCCDQMGELADISVGDAWLPEVLNRNDGGWSMVVARTIRGENFLSMGQKEGIIYLGDIDYSKAIKSQASLLIYKKRGIYARVNLRKLFGEGVPSYTLIGNKYSKSNIFDYLGGILLLIATRIVKKSITVRKVINNAPQFLLSFYAFIARNLLMQYDLCGKVKRKFKFI